ncbi:MAG: hydrogenase iron-sulfur subunit [Gemmatimonadetes bacterium]|nr:hydrogenase iron-sulfur subunit [Gemmatimonadota bacterium]MYB98002.1 hydrogenase iron-sulfur subunit [Gemmatimonadota bacterium]MYI46631.1 hydrogenase iron-sulfur subunit [Gemmatimonadota bacterium]
MLKRLLGQALTRLDGWVDRLYGWRWNPLYQSGALVIACLAVLLVTGLYLIFFYRIGSPYESMVRIDGQPWGGRWIRSLHRYAADAAVVAAVLHALRMFCQGRTWGPRALAWISGVFLVFLLYICGWTGYVMVWDVHGQLLATEGARLLDALPLFSEPVSRTFAGDSPLPSAFFFMNLFLHIAIPVGLAMFLWLHVSRVARPVLLPPKPLLWTSVGLLSAAAILLPVPLQPAADLLRIPGEVGLNVFYSFWLPAAGSTSPAMVWVAGGAVAVVLVAIPFLTRPHADRRPAPSVVSSRLCTSCEQCYVDCPYDAIRMVERSDGRDGLVARVNPDSCVSCGICAGSCAPMGVGPPGRTGRDQLARVREFAARHSFEDAKVVLVGCGRSAAGASGENGPPRFPVSCAGNLHSSVVEYLVRAGARGVLVVACPPRDCWGREGPTWLVERLFNEREAELKARVDRKRVRVAHASLHDGVALETALQDFVRALARLDAPAGEDGIEVDLECELSQAAG